MEFDDDLQQYIVEHNGILFSWDDEPEEYGELVQNLSKAFWDKIDSLARYISADIEEMYGAHSIEEIKEKLGMPNIDPNSCACHHEHNMNVSIITKW